jgi:hypothetical protein
VSSGAPATAPHRDLLRGARDALDGVAAAEAQYLESRPYRLHHRYDPRASVYTVRVDVATPPPEGLAARVAAVLRDLGAALDALATALVGASSGAPPVRFPIHDSLPQFAQRSRRALSPMPDAAQATIEALQPYHTFGGFQHDALWLLRELSASSPPMLAAGALRDDSAIGVNTARHVGVVGALRVAAGAFDDGAVVATVAARVTGPDPKLDLYLRPSFEMAFASQGPARGAALVGTLRAICDRVEQGAFARLEPLLAAR